MTDSILLNEYLYNPGLSGIKKYVQQHNIKKVSVDVRKYILQDIYENTAGGVSSASYKEAKILLQL